MRSSQRENHPRRGYSLIELPVRRVQRGYEESQRIFWRLAECSLGPCRRRVRRQGLVATWRASPVGPTRLLRSFITVRPRTWTGHMFETEPGALTTEDLAVFLERLGAVGGESLEEDR